MAGQKRDSFVIAVDAGGTHTRVRCFALDGTPLAAATGAGGSAQHNDDAAQSFGDTVAAALAAGGLDPGRAVALAAGLAGMRLDDAGAGERSAAWAEAFYAMPWLDCPRRFVNDAVVAHHAALQGKPGVIVIAGTGSMILAITADGGRVESGAYQHYAGGARHLAYDLVQQLIIGRAFADDAGLVAEVLRTWGLTDVAGLRPEVVRLSGIDRNEAKRRWGRLAPLVTARADTSPLADVVLRRLADATAAGALLVAGEIGTVGVPAALAGALATDPAFVVRFEQSLSVQGGAACTMVRSAPDPLLGAALMAYELAGVTVDADLSARVLGVAAAS